MTGPAALLTDPSIQHAHHPSARDPVTLNPLLAGAGNSRGTRCCPYTALASDCMAVTPLRRPSMADVVERLDTIAAEQQLVTRHLMMFD